MVARVGGRKFHGATKEHFLTVACPTTTLSKVLSDEANDRMTIANDIRHLGAFAKSFLGSIESRKYSFNGSPCAYLRGGNGPLVVLLHGSAVTKTYWRQIMQILSPYYQVMAFEVPGYNVDGPLYWTRFTFKHLSQWLAETLDAVGVSPNTPLHVVGYCSGAALSSYFAATHPERVRSLTLLSIPYIYVDPHMTLEERKAILESRWVENEEEFYALLKKAFADPPYIPAMAVKRYVRNMQGKRNLFAQMVEDTCSSSPLLVSKLGQIKIPTLAMTGDRDSLSPIDYMQRLALSIPQLKQHVIPKCSHLSLVEQPEIIGRHILDFFADI